MTADEVSDEMLMAAVDGELEAAQVAEIERLAAANPPIARRMAAFRESRLAAVAAFADVLAEPVPERLVAAAEGKLVRLAPVRRPWRRYAVAAAFVLIAGASAFVGSRMSSPPAGSVLARAADPRLLEALADTPTGVDIEEAGVVARILASYRVEGGYCRLYTVGDGAPGSVRALACGAEGTFSVVLAAAGDGREGAYEPAGDVVAGSIDSNLDAAGAGPALTPEEEAASLAAGWIP